MTAISVSERLLEMAAFYTWLDFTLTKEQPEKADARLMACVRFLRRRSPAGLRCLVCNLAVLLFFALRSVLSACARQGGHHHSWRALHVVETPDARLSKRLICYFLGLTDSSLIPAAQNIIPFSLQIPEEPAGDPLVLSLLSVFPLLALIGTIEERDDLGTGATIGRAECLSLIHI